MALMKENEMQKKGSILQMMVGIILAGLAFTLMFLLSNLASLGFYMDLPSLILLVLLCFSGILITGKKTKMEIVDFLQKILIPISAFITLFELVVILGQIDDPALLGPNLAVCILVPLYAVTIYLVLTVIKERAAGK